jgi:thiol-disulfide isomerase/thioredoxin
MSSRHANHAPGRLDRWPLALLGLTLAVLAPLTTAQEVDEVMRGFAPAGDFLIEIDGTVNKAAEILLAERPQAYLLIAPELGGPILLELRRGTVSRVHMMKLLRRNNNIVDMVANATPKMLSRYELEGRAVTFKIGQTAVRMIEKPPLVGLHPQASLTEHSPAYSRSAAAYHPDAGALEKLRANKSDVRVRVYFGSWCSHCKRHVPSMLRVENELADAQSIRFEYYGLPKPGPGQADWPDGVRNVPTAIIFVGGKEVGRLKDNQWRSPELALSQLVTGGGSAAGR